MEDEFFQYLGPGICFVTPLYLVACWVALATEKGESLRDFILVGGSATVPALAVPFGWWIYNCYRAFRQLTTSQYERKPFIRAIRDRLKIVYDPQNSRYLVDFSALNPEVGWRAFSEADFALVFNPFRKGRRRRRRQERQGQIELSYLEPVSDLMLFTHEAFEYARTISSVRYGIDSSLFALVFGVPISIGLMGLVAYLGSEQLVQQLQQVNPNLWRIMIVLPLLVLVVLTVLRRKQADREYSSRLTLITTTSGKAATVNGTEYDTALPRQITEKINQLETTEDRYAAFDLDNTLLIGDIGEALLATLLQKQVINSLTWKEYERLRKENPHDAYVAAVQAMKGLPLAKVIDATEEIVSSSASSIDLEGAEIPVPRPNSLMQLLVLSLRLRGIDIYIVTSSSQIAAEVVAWQFFGIPSDHVLGVRSELIGSGYGRSTLGRVERPVPYAEGKVSALQSRRASRPLITAGDSQQDISLLSYTAEKGILFWVDGAAERENALYEKMIGTRRAIVINQNGVVSDNSLRSETAPLT